MFKLFLINLLLFSTVSFGKEIVHTVTDENSNIEQIKFYEIIDNELVLKRLIDLYDDGKSIKMENNFKDNDSTGVVINYWFNGQKKEEGNYMNGKREGLHNRWFQNGQKDAEATFKNGLENGVVKRWYENGKKWLW